MVEPVHEPEVISANKRAQRKEQIVDVALRIAAALAVAAYCAGTLTWMAEAFLGIRLF